MPVGAGKLEYRLRFEKQVKTSDSGGGSTITWTEQFTVWGGVTLPMLRSRMEAIAAGAVQSGVNAEVIVRDTSDTRTITKDWRAVMTTDHSVSPQTEEVWNIRKVYPRERDGFIRMEAEAGVPT